MFRNVYHYTFHITIAIFCGITLCWEFSRAEDSPVISISLESALEIGTTRNLEIQAASKRYEALQFQYYQDISPASPEY